MAKAPHLTQKVKNLIAQIYLDNPSWGPTAIHKELLKKMKEIGLDRYFGPNWPGVSSVRGVVGNIKANAELNPELEDKPWSVAALAYYDIPPEVLPIVLAAWAKMLEEDKPLTIRQAKWIARLYYIFKDKDTDLLTAAIMYASFEQALRLTGGYPEKLLDMWFLWHEDISLYKVLEPSKANGLLLKYTKETKPILNKIREGLKDQSTKENDIKPQFVGSPEFNALPDSDKERIMKSLKKGVNDEGINTSKG